MSGVHLGFASAPATVGQAAARLAALFREAQLPTPGLDARILAAEACGLDAGQALADPGREVTARAALRLADFGARRLAGEPVSRILGRREFWGLTFHLSPDMLDPRPETELLVEAALEYAGTAGHRDRPLRILDLGTGSGCILAALLSELPRSFGVGADRSLGALTGARENFRRLGLLERTALLCTNWASAIPDASFDIVVSNPPYIASSDIRSLDKAVVHYDPRIALDGGEDGLEAFKAIVPHIRRVLRTGGFLAVENGAGQASVVLDMICDLIPNAGILTDISGIGRAVAGVRQSRKSQALAKKKIGNVELSG